MPDSKRVLIPHIDDVACARGANTAMFDAPPHSTITSGSVMVPAAWFPDAAARARRRQVDLGIHLTLTSESSAFRWAPVTTRDPGTGLIDRDGYMWSTVPELRAHADPAAVDIELRGQIQRAVDAGIDVTHLDHHMGAALAPEFVDVTAGIARDLAIPMLFPEDIAGYVAVLNMGDVDLDALRAAQTALASHGLAVADRFLMGLTYMHEPDAAATMRHLLSALGDGTTYLSLHCTAPGDIEVVHPKDAHWRSAEFDVFTDAGFSRWVREQDFDLRGMRHYRNAVRGGP